MKYLVEDNGLSLNDCVKTLVFITDFNDYAAINEAYKKYFTSDFPPRSCVAVASLPKNAKFEIEAIFLKQWASLFNFHLFKNNLTHNYYSSELI